MRLSWPLPPVSWPLPDLAGAWPGDLTVRARHAVRRISARGLTEGWARHTREGPAPHIATLRAGVLAASPPVREGIQRAAQPLTEGRFGALGRDWPRRWPGTPFSADLWRLDPTTGRLWPGADTFTFDIQLAPQPRLGPVRYALELNRLHFLQPLAADVLLSGNTAALATLEEAIESWHRANPPFRGIAWSRGIECALRAISLVVVAALAGDRLSHETQARLRACLTAHAFWIDRFRTPASSGTLENLAEATAELLIASALPDLPRAAALGARARNDLQHMADHLFLDDGTPASGSPQHGALAAELLLLAAVVARGDGHPLAASVDQRLARFARFIGWLADARGGVPALGENDESRVLWLGTAQACTAGSVARSIAAYGGEVPAGLPSRPVHLRDAIFGVPSDPSPAPALDGLATFAHGGLSVLREQRAGRALSLVLCGHGASSTAPGASHGGHHADALALLAAVDGRPLLVDAGAYLDPAAPDWEAWFRCAAAHNTLAILAGGAEPGAGLPAARHGVDARLERAVDGPQWLLDASHGGYLRSFGVRHARTLAATAEGFTVHDRLIGSDMPLKVEIVFQLAADCMAVRDDRAIVVTPAHGGAPVRLIFETPGDVSLSRGGGLGTGWVATGFGLKTPAWRISWRGRIASAGSLVRVVLSA